MSTLKLPQEHRYANGRTCNCCSEFKSIDNFQLERDSRATYGIAVRSTCKQCRQEQKWRTDLKRRYGITHTDYCNMLDEQKGKCAICNSEQNNSAMNTDKLFVDHCHTTGEVRGLLCSKCNHAIGLLDDNIDNLYAAIAYLSK